MPVALDGSQRRSLESFAGTRVHAVAALGNPERFFATLRCAGIDLVAHPLPDHGAIDPALLLPADGHPVLITEKMA